MSFSILFWNVWDINQSDSKTKLDRLIQELEKLIKQYQPDCVALCELVQPPEYRSQPVIKYLEKLGYAHNHQARLAHLSDYWMSGVALCSRFKLTDKQRHVISKNGSAARYGFPGIDKEIISATISLPGALDAKIIVAHPGAIPDSVKQHRVAMKSLEKLVRSEPFTQNTLLMGDMNEWRFIPGSFRHKVADIMHSRTGSILQPTWRYNAHRFAPLRLNLDYIYWGKQGNFLLKDFTVLSTKVSDHQPLLATFEYK